MLEKAVGKNYFQATKILESELKSNGNVKEFDIRFQLPPSLAVYVTERKAVAALSIPGQAELILVDAEGLELEKTPQSQLPQVVFESGYEGDDMQFIISLVSNLYSYYHLRSTRVDDYSIYAKVNDRLEFVFPKKGDLDVLLGSVELLLFRLKTIDQNSTIDTSNMVTQVDFRYKNPIIRYIK